MFARRFKIVSILSNPSGDTYKLFLVKAVKDTMGLMIKESLDLVNRHAGQDLWINIDGRVSDKTNFFDEMKKYAELQIDWEDEPDYGSAGELSTLEKEALEWYDKQDVLTKVMIDNYITALGLAPICVAG